MQRWGSTRKNEENIQCEGSDPEDKKRRYLKKDGVLSCVKCGNGFQEVRIAHFYCSVEMSLVTLRRAVWNGFKRE